VYDQRPMHVGRNVWDGGDLPCRRSLHLDDMHVPDHGDQSGGLL